MKATIWSEPFKVRYYEIGSDSRVTLQTICNYFQEAANNHATELGAGMQQLLAQGQSWVLSRFLIHMQEFPSWPEEVIIETWPSGIQRMFAMRCFRIRIGGRVIGSGTSAWLLFDIYRRRPLRPDIVRDLVLEDEQKPGCETTLSQKLHTPEQFLWERAFTVRMSDLDMNQHVNNVKYIDWALEATPADIRRTHRPHRLHIEFFAECGAGEEVVSRCAPDESGNQHVFHHAVCRSREGTVLAGATTHWEAF